MSTTDTDGGTGAIPNPNLLASKYKDPLDYDNVTDFGIMPEVHSNPTSLRPNEHGVSFERCKIYNYFVKKLCQLIACAFVMCRALSAVG